MEKQEVIELMKSSKNSKEWNENCDKVKKDNNNDYPSWWYFEIILSGLCDNTLGSGSSKMKISSIGES
nr:hypothetical protein [uncultured archaeon]